MILAYFTCKDSRFGGSLEIFFSCVIKNKIPAQSKIPILRLKIISFLFTHASIIYVFFKFVLVFIKLKTCFLNLYHCIGKFFGNIMAKTHSIK